MALDFHSLTASVMRCGLAPEDYAAWLGEDSATPSVLLALLKPYPSEAMRAYPVRTVVNSPKNDRPECIEPAA